MPEAYCGHRVIKPRGEKRWYFELGGYACTVCPKCPGNNKDARPRYGPSQSAELYDLR